MGRSGAGFDGRTLSGMTPYFSEELVSEALPMADAVRAVEAVFAELGAGGAENRPRQRVRVPGRMLHTMSAGSAELGFCGLKTYLTGRDGARFVVLLFDVRTGSLAAVMEAEALGRIRTGAATGVAADYLAPTEARACGIVGCGFQAGAQLEALAVVRPLERVAAYCRAPDRRRAFAEEMSRRLEIPVAPAPSAEAAVAGMDIVVAATSAREPVIHGAWLTPGAFVAGIGGNSLRRRELDRETVLGAERIVVDDLEQAKIECGDLAAVVETGDLAWDRVETLGAVVAAGARAAPPGGALFESQGIAAEDIAAAAVVYRRALGEAVSLPIRGLETPDTNP